MAANSDLAQVCSECGSVLGQTKNLDPMSALYSETQAISTGVYRPTRPIVLVMVWVIFLPWLVAAGFGMLSAITTPGMNGFIFFWIFTGNAVLDTVALYRVTRNYRKSRSDADRPIT